MSGTTSELVSSELVSGTMSGTTLALALAEAHKELKNPAKDRENPYFESKYATLDALQNASRSILAKHGLTITQVCQPGQITEYGVAPLHTEKVTTEVTDKEGAVTKGEGFRILPFMWVLKTKLMHISGEEIESLMPLVSITKGPQQFGSELTYMRRYAYAAILNMTADEDDDANAAQEHPLIKDKSMVAEKKTSKKKEEKKEDLLDGPKVDDPWKVTRPKGSGPVDTDKRPDEIPGLEKGFTPQQIEEAKRTGEIKQDFIDETPKKNPEELTLLEQTRIHLQEDGFTEEEFMTLIRSFKLTRVVMLKDVDDKVLSSVLAKWETVQKRIMDGRQAIKDLATLSGGVK
jgi:hypothetical protein